MARPGRCLWVAFVVCLAAPPAWAAAPHAGGALITLAGLGREETEGYLQYEGYVAWPLKRKWQWDSGWHGGMELHASAGLIRLNGQAGLMATLGPVAVLVSPSGGLMLHAGCRPTGLTRTHFPPLDLGIWGQFTSHVGLAMRMGRNLWLGYRLQHMSNAGADDRNIGVNMSTFEVRAQW